MTTIDYSYDFLLLSKLALRYQMFHELLQVENSKSRSSQCQEVIVKTSTCSTGQEHVGVVSAGASLIYQ
jgi:hypothetical protein